MDQVQVDVQQRRLARLLADDVRVPDPLEERCRHSVDLSAGGVRAEQLQLPRLRADLAQCALDLVVERVPGEDGVEAVPPRRVRDRPRDELDEVDAVPGERLDRAVERARPVVGDERERRSPLLVGRGRAACGWRRRRSVCTSPGGRRRRPRSRSDRTTRRRARLRLPPPRDRRAPPPRRPPRPSCPRRSRSPTASPRAGGGTGRGRPGASGRPGSAPAVPARSPSRQCRTRSTVSSTIDSGDAWSRSCVSAIGPESVLSIGRTPNSTSPATVASATAVKLGSGTTSRRRREQPVARGRRVRAVSPGVGDADAHQRLQADGDRQLAAPADPHRRRRGARRARRTSGIAQLQ